MTFERILKKLIFARQAYITGARFMEQAERAGDPGEQQELRQQAEGHFSRAQIIHAELQPWHGQAWPEQLGPEHGKQIEAVEHSLTTLMIGPWLGRQYRLLWPQLERVCHLFPQMLKPIYEQAHRGSILFPQAPEGAYAGGGMPGMAQSGLAKPAFWRQLDVWQNVNQELVTVVERSSEGELPFPPEEGEKTSKAIAGKSEPAAAITSQGLLSTANASQPQDTATKVEGSLSGDKSFHPAQENATPKAMTGKSEPAAAITSQGLLSTDNASQPQDTATKAEGSLPGDKSFHPAQDNADPEAMAETSESTGLIPSGSPIPTADDIQLRTFLPPPPRLLFFHLGKSNPGGILYDPTGEVMEWLHPRHQETPLENDGQTTATLQEKILEKLQVLRQAMAKQNIRQVQWIVAPPTSTEAWQQVKQAVPAAYSELFNNQAHIMPVSDFQWAAFRQSSPIPVLSAQSLPSPVSLPSALGKADTAVRQSMDSSAATPAFTPPPGRVDFQERVNPRPTEQPLAMRTSPGQPSSAFTNSVEAEKAQNYSPTVAGAQGVWPEPPEPVLPRSAEFKTEINSFFPHPADNRLQPEYPAPLSPASGTMPPITTFSLPLVDVKAAEAPSHPSGMGVAQIRPSGTDNLKKVNAGRRGEQFFAPATAAPRALAEPSLAMPGKRALNTGVPSSLLPLTGPASRSTSPALPNQPRPGKTVAHYGTPWQQLIFLISRKSGKAGSSSQDQVTPAVHRDVAAISTPRAQVNPLRLAAEDRSGFTAPTGRNTPRRQFIQEAAQMFYRWYTRLKKQESERQTMGQGGL